MADSLDQLILFRVLQGLAGGGSQLSSQGALLDAFPAEKQADSNDFVWVGRACCAGRRANTLAVG